MNCQGSVSLFSLLSISQEDRRFPRAQVCRGGWNKGMDQTLFKDIFACREESSGKALPQRIAAKEPMTKLSCQSLSNQIFYF
jgi:hypothetical protein